MTSSPTPPTDTTVTTGETVRTAELVLAMAWCAASLVYMGYRWGLEDAARSQGD